jgi:asparagine synthase (glutamine-hydrolysing)
MRLRAQGRKWILREAMKGVLPEEVRTRRQKGGIDARILWALQQERPLIDALLTDPILGQYGCIDVNAVRHMVENARIGKCENPVQLMSVLGLETWLCARLGAWPTGVSLQSAA